MCTTQALKVETVQTKRCNTKQWCGVTLHYMDTIFVSDVDAGVGWEVGRVRWFGGGGCVNVLFTVIICLLLHTFNAHTAIV